MSLFSLLVFACFAYFCSLVLASYCLLLVAIGCFCCAFRSIAAQVSMHSLLGGSWALLTLILHHIFAFVFKIDFPSIVYRVWKGFGRVFEILGVWGDMLFETLILIEFCLIFGEVDGEKDIVFWFFLVLFCVFFPNVRNLKNRAPV